jgi:hypothetical protein
MGRYGDNTGVDHTCPYIDRVRDFIESLPDFCEQEGIEKDVKQFSEMLEKIRQMNLDLRNFGNKQYEELYEMEKDRDYEKKRADDLEKQVASLEEDVKYYEKQVRELESQQ